MSFGVLFESAETIRLECAPDGRPGLRRAVGGENWRDYRVEVEVFPEKGFAGFEFYVQDDGWGGANVHFIAGDRGVQMGGVWGGVVAWKLWPYVENLPPIAPGRWTKLRIDAGESFANLYVDGKSAAAFTALPFSRGGVRPWAYAGEACFRNLRVAALEPGELEPVAGDPWAALNRPGTIRRWQVAGAAQQDWTAAETDARGVLNFDAVLPRRNEAKLAFARTVLRAETAGARQAWVTYTDRFTLSCNGKAVFTGRPRGWFDPDREQLGNSRLIPDHFALELPLRAGDNVLLVQSEATEPFGQGFWIRVE